ncbi:MAG TPA: hypothetical protein VNO55_19965 [Polyangia bacterium]|nr:hypothetical protein [Polyangia bacterium]
MNNRLVGWIALMGLAMAGTAGCGLPPAPAEDRLWTLNDYVALYRGNGHADGVAPLPEAVPAAKLLVDAGNDHYQLVMSPTYEDGYQAAYVTTDLWQGFDEIWVQPLYILVSGFGDTGAPALFPADDPRSHPIFGVGPKSRFYSPYWETIYVKVPADAPDDRYRSVRDIVNDHTLETRHGEARTASLISPTLTVDPPAVDRDRYPALPLPDQTGPTVVRGHGYLDGNDIDYLDFGTGAFHWDSARIVEEVPLFDLAFRDTDGVLRPMGGPKIGGAGPPFSGRQPLVDSTNRPRYGGYWRLYYVELPATARIFAPPQFASFRAALMKAGAPLADISPDVAAAPAEDLRRFVGAVALDPACFVDPKKIGGCLSLINSQYQLENNLDATALIKTDLTVTCPFVSYRSAPVPNP